MRNEQDDGHLNTDYAPDREGTYHDVSFEDSREVTEVAPSVTERFPTDLIEPVVEPVADV
jgi:hypothetical protein